MRSPWSGARVGRAAIASLAILVVLVTAGFVGMRRVPALAFARQEVPAIDLPDRSWFPVLFPNGTQLDHHILWNGIGASIENARRADVIFVGNSTLGFALPDHEVRAFEKRSRLSAFSLALPAEAAGFTLALIEKFDLRPRVVVANVPGFFEGLEGPFAKRARGDGAWTGRTMLWEERLAATVWPVASRLLPSFVMPRSSSTLVRSSTHGTWKPQGFPNRRVPVSTRPATPAWDHEAALRFRDALTARGTQLVLMCVPTASDQCSTTSIQPVARALGVQAVCPRMDAPLWMVDTAHMRQLSGKRFAQAFLRELGTLDVIRAISRERRGNGRGSDV
jgi:hypothetical protein